MAYDKLDKNGDGTVTLDDIKMAYDVSYHPDVNIQILFTLSNSSYKINFRLYSSEENLQTKSSKNSCKFGKSIKSMRL